MIERKDYLQTLISWKDDKVIKVITGIRRCGKSTLLMQYKNYLLDTGINDKQIISINFEELENEDLLDYRQLYKYIKNQLYIDGTTYIILDEIQKVANFEKVVDSLYVKDNIDIYITGSNAYLLSSELSTLLTGRYIEISMLPLSFKEYYSLSKESKDIAFSQYLKYGGLPYISQLNNIDEKINIYLEGIYNTVIVKDIEERQNRKEINSHKRKINNISLLKTVSKYLSSVAGSIVSTKSVTNYLISSGRKVSPNTINDYIDALTESFIYYPVDRFDIAGKQLLKFNKKYYIVDLGLRNYILPKKEYDLGFSIENIVYFELLRRGYRVNIGNIGDAEVDFIAQKNNAFVYFQVTANMTSEETFNREMRVFAKIKDNYEKIVLTLDRFSPGNYNGIKVVNIIDWLIDQN